MSPLICLGLAGAAYNLGAIDVSALFLVGFDGILRTQSLLLLRVGHVQFLRSQAVVKLVRTKTTMRNGGVELSVIRSRLAVNMRRLACMGSTPTEFGLSRSPHVLITCLES